MPNRIFHQLNQYESKASFFWYTHHKTINHKYKRGKNEHYSSIYYNNIFKINSLSLLIFMTFSIGMAPVASGSSDRPTYWHMVSVINENEAIAVDLDNFVYRTTDGGETWDYVTYNTKQVSAISIDKFFAITPENNLWRTFNGGDNYRQVSWEYLNDDTKQVSAVNMSDFFAVSPTNDLWSTYDGGETWENVTYNIEQVSAISMNELYAVTPENNVNKTSDGGKTLRS